MYIYNKTVNTYSKPRQMPNYKYSDRYDRVNNEYQTREATTRIESALWAVQAGIYIHIKFFLFHHKNLCCGYSLEAPQQGTSNEYPQHVFMEK